MNRLLIFSIFLFLLVNYVKPQGGCLTSYTGLSIFGNDLDGVRGTASACCQLCQQKSGCRAWTWDNTNGGTCWLKSDTQPLYQSDPQTHAISGMMSPDAANTYSIGYDFNSTHFWDYRWHFQYYDLTNLTLNVNETVAKDLGLVGYQDGKAYMGVDHTKQYPDSGRPAVQVATGYLFNAGLFILDLAHMPTGPGVWPAFWTSGPHWPDLGEIDILEAVANMTSNHITLHTGQNCVMPTNNSIFFNGNWSEANLTKEYLDCWQYGQPNATVTKGPSCSVVAPPGTFNTGFNQAGGGVFALQWEPGKYLRIWNFVRPNIPADILSENPNPNPDTWGLPTAYFQLGQDCDGPSHFANHTIIFDIAFCGGWADQYIDGGAAACQKMVQLNPELYTDTYWLINYLKIFYKPGQR